MITKLKYLALLLGIIGMLAVPAGARNDSVDRAVGSELPGHPRLLLAAASSLLATGNQKPAPETDQRATVPELIAAELLFEFGRVLEGTEVVHDFLIENRGAGDLLIEQVRTG